MKWVGALITAFCMTLLFESSGHAVSGSVVFSEVQAGSNSSASEEFIELRNSSSIDIDVTGWSVMYYSAASGSATPTGKRLAVLEGTLKSRGFLLLSSESNDSTGATKKYLEQADGVFSAGLAYSGYLKLEAPVENEAPAEVADLVGWGSGATLKSETAPAQVLSAGKSIKRLVNADGQLIDTNNNLHDFQLSSEPFPQSGDVYIPDEPEEIPPVPTEPEPPLEYLAIKITELLPNPASPLADSEAEFIELHNPHGVSVNVEGYALKTGANLTYSYELPSLVIEPGEYLVFYSSETKLALSNTSGKAQLSDPAGTVVNETEMYNGAKEGQSWAEVDGEWQFMDPTPHAENIAQAAIGTPIKEEDAAPVTKEKTLEPCPQGKYRNPETNRCKAMVSEDDNDSLTPCKPGQERNSETNRCRSIGSVLAAGLTPCQPGQERNPATNRCRKVGDEQDGLKPCQAGYERNPETNRCRKVMATPATHVASISGDLDAQPSAVPMSLQWWVTGLAATGVLGYGMYEWRHEVFSFIQKLRGSLFRSAPPE